MMRESKRFLGLDLAGAKNQKTTLASLEFYPKEKKIFLLDVYDKVAAKDDLSRTGDQVLLELIEELKPGIAKIGVNVALELPPCIVCARKSCPLPSKCSVSSVKWMRETSKKAKPARDFTPYTQRPIELWVRNHVFPRVPPSHRFDIDETLGGSKAPLTARMHFLKRHLSGYDFLEVWPKLSVSALALQLELNKRTISNYRNLESGSHAREEILESMVEQFGLFIYERDVRKLSHNLSAFDSFICAYTALLSYIGLCARPPSGFPLHSGWIHYPLLNPRP